MNPKVIEKFLYLGMIGSRSKNYNLKFLTDETTKSLTDRVKLLHSPTWSHLTLALSSSLVSITIVELRCSQTILQKSAKVSGSGPCKSMNKSLFIMFMLQQYHIVYHAFQAHLSRDWNLVKRKVHLIHFD